MSVDYFKLTLKKKQKEIDTNLKHAFCLIAHNVVTKVLKFLRFAGFIGLVTFDPEVKLTPKFIHTTGNLTEGYIRF